MYGTVPAHPGPRKAYQGTKEERAQELNIWMAYNREQQEREQGNGEAVFDGRGRSLYI